MSVKRGDYVCVGEIMDGSIMCGWVERVHFVPGINAHTVMVTYRKRAVREYDRMPVAILSRPGMVRVIRRRR